MSAKRTNLIYENCCVYSPEGKLMFRCLEKRAKWYIDRNLAVIVENNPLSIRLTFKPKGNGEKEQFLKHQRENKCVVCGEKDLTLLTRHHLVPYEYRKHFPNDKKDHNSFYIVPICRKCHDQYNLIARELNKKLDIECNAPINGFSKKKIPALKSLKALIKNYDFLPEKTKDYLTNDLFQYLLSKKIVSNIEEIKSIEKLKIINLLFEKEVVSNNNSHGKIVVEYYINNLDFLEKMWINDFITKMKPKYMPKYLSGNKSFFNNFIKKLTFGWGSLKIFINRFWNFNKSVLISVF